MRCVQRQPQDRPGDQPLTRLGLRWLAFATVVCFAVITGLAGTRGALAAVTATKPSIAVAPMEGTPGTLVTVTGEHWPPNEPVFVYFVPLGSPLPGETAATPAGSGSTGTAQGSSSPSPDAIATSPGPYEVVACTDCANPGHRSATPFAVLASAPITTGEAPPIGNQPQRPATFEPSHLPFTALLTGLSHGQSIVLNTVLTALVAFFGIRSRAIRKLTVEALAHPFRSSELIETDDGTIFVSSKTGDPSPEKQR